MNSPGMPNMAAKPALASASSCSSPPQRGTSWPGAEDTWRQNSRSALRRFSGGLPAMMAPLMAPMETPATQSMDWYLACMTSNTPAW